MRMNIGGLLAVGLLTAGQCLMTRLAAAQTPNVRCVETPTAVEIWSGEQLLLRYNTQIVEPPAGLNPAFRRSGHIHPLNTPAGRTLTAEFPPDHAHQHGMFFAWTSTRFKGRKVDFWNQAALTGTVRHREVKEVLNTTDMAGFKAVLEHVALLPDGSEEVVLEEEWMLTAVPPSQAGFRVELTSRQTNVSDAPFTLLEYHYGGMAFRGSSDWLGRDRARFLTNEGLGRLEGNHSRPNWVALQGELDGAICSVAYVSHAGNFRSPQPVRLHPDKPYFVHSPQVLGEHTIFPGESLISKYQILTNDAPAEPQTLDEVFRRFQ